MSGRILGKNWAFHYFYQVKHKFIFTIFVVILKQIGHHCQVWIALQSLCSILNHLIFILSGFFNSFPLRNAKVLNSPPANLYQVKNFYMKWYDHDLEWLFLEIYLSAINKANPYSRLKCKCVHMLSILFLAF